MSFKTQNLTDFTESAKFQRELPGQVFTTPMKSLPIDRPADIPDPQLASERLFRAMMKKGNATKLIALMRGKVPVEMIAANIVNNLVMEGATTPMAGMLIIPSTVIMLSRIAEAAKIQPTFMDEKKIIEPDVAQIQSDSMRIGPVSDTVKNAVKTSSDELSGNTKTDKGIGILQDPLGAI